MQRRRTKHVLTLAERLVQEAERIKEEAKKLPPGFKRESLLRKARQDEITAHLADWLNTPGLQSPK